MLLRLKWHSFFKPRQIPEVFVYLFDDAKSIPLVKCLTSMLRQNKNQKHTTNMQVKVEQVNVIPKLNKPGKLHTENSNFRGIVITDVTDLRRPC